VRAQVKNDFPCLFDGVRSRLGDIFQMIEHHASSIIVLSLCLKRRAEICGRELKKAVRFRGGRFEHFGTDAGAPRHVGWIEVDAENGGAVIHDDNHAFHFSDGKFSPFDAGSNFSQISRIPNRKIYCIFYSEKFPECFIDGRWQSFSRADGLPQEKLLFAA
jgi:hypothetical protein